MAKPKSTGRELHTIGGEHRTIIQWCEHYGIRVSTVYSRLNRGMTLEQALTTPVVNVGFDLITMNGESRTMVQWAAHYGVKVGDVYARMKRGRSLEEALTATPPHGGNRVYEFNGESHYLRHWAEMYGMKYYLLMQRIKTMSLEEALTTPVVDRRKNKNLITDAATSPDA